MTQLENIIELARQHPDIAALWLYGSRARGDNHDTSDYDLAVVFTHWLDNALERRLRPEELAIDWQCRLNMPEGTISVIDLAIAPVPLGWNVLSEGKLLLNKSPSHRMKAEQRIYSMWELDYVHANKAGGMNE
ncbi:nucleotidyltransferase domain-containing protein [Oceanimonas sp. GK1]|uniref:type VII toxin-antitoxin system MntA family adenylyltransferase antitoxin n=1 Tax=Oceanimonas sp. (strain GK1 / IBRC-M 10197) TaxID=511062 RepID=UPI0002E723C9|nr:nucleotidyltransferase domain-containing protein [Oceanimonas sp. GK1]